jgi:hypothetical protein
MGEYETDVTTVSSKNTIEWKKKKIYQTGLIIRKKQNHLYVTSNGAINTTIILSKTNRYYCTNIYLCSFQCDMFRPSFLGHPQAIHKPKGKSMNWVKMHNGMHTLKAKLFLLIYSSTLKTVKTFDSLNATCKTAKLVLGLGSTHGWL